MKMGQFEKRFVNSGRHSGRVAEQAERRLRRADPKPGQQLLDVGCGNGAVAIHAARAFGLASFGVDIDPEQIEAACLAADGVDGVRFLVADATALPFSDGEFDLVYSNKTTTTWASGAARSPRWPGCSNPARQLVYADFVAPFGHCLPTGPGIDATAAAHGLERKRHVRTPSTTAPATGRPTQSTTWLSRRPDRVGSRDRHRFAARSALSSLDGSPLSELLRHAESTKTHPILAQRVRKARAHPARGEIERRRKREDVRILRPPQVRYARALRRKVPRALTACMRS
jgi:SAM-dependent methyltransferase